jgi:division protein CdvB (Snf7/Vps24/ESCRT-III family)
LIFRRQKRKSPRIKMLELIVSLRYATSKLGLQIAKVNATYQRTRDPNLLQLLKNLLRLQAALEVLTVRLETLVEVGAVSAETLSTLKQLFAELRVRYGDIAPAITSMLADLENAITAIASSTGYEFTFDIPRTTSNEVKRILEEAEEIAKQRLEEIRTSLR